MPRGRGDGMVDLAGNDYLGLVPRPGRDRGRRPRRRAVGRRRRCVTAGHRHPRPPRRARAGARRLPRSAVGAGAGAGYAANLAVVTALADRAASSSPTPTSMPRWSTPPGFARRGRRRPAQRRRARSRALSGADGSGRWCWPSPSTRCSATRPARELADVCARVRRPARGRRGARRSASTARAWSHRLGLAGLPHVVVTATLSKSLGSQGGAVLGPSALRDAPGQPARPFIFDTALAPAPPVPHWPPSACCATARRCPTWSAPG